MLVCMYSLASAQGVGTNHSVPDSAGRDETPEIIQEVKEVPNTITMPTIWPTHAAIMAFATVLLIVSMFIARNKSHDRFWLPKHQVLGIVSPFLLLIGFGSVFYMLAITHQEHFDVPHAWFGAIVILVAFLVPILGFIMMKKPGSKIPLRKIHLWLGRLTILAMLAVAASGLFTTGLFAS